MVYAAMMSVIGFGRARKGKERLRVSKKHQRLHYKHKATKRMQKNALRKRKVMHKIVRASKQANRRRAA